MYPSFQGVNRHFDLSFENNNNRTRHNRHLFLKVQIKDCKLWLMERTFDNIQEIATGQGDGYSKGSLIGFPYFWKHYKMIEIDLN